MSFHRKDAPAGRTICISLRQAIGNWERVMRRQCFRCSATRLPNANRRLATASDTVTNQPKTFINYFLPTPIVGSLTTNVWGAATVGPRDPKNGLEDETMKHWNYWDGQIIKAPDGKYHLFSSRWDQASGHSGWWNSQAVHAVSDNLIGPYVDKGLCWPDNEGGKGHNVTALVLPDGRYAVVISETRPGTVFVSKSLDGPWEELGLIQVATNEFSKLGRMSNTSIMVRPDGNFEIVPRSGAILISTNGVLGPYVVQGPSIYPNIAGMPQHDRQNLEDPAVWFSGGLYHIIVNNWSDRKAYHLTSTDGIHDWTFRGSPTTRRKISSATPTAPSTTGQTGTPRRLHRKRPCCRRHPGGD